MILITLLIVIMLERTIAASSYLHHPFYYQQYRSIVAKFVTFEQSDKIKQDVLLTLLLPCIAILFLQTWLDDSLLLFVFNVFVLFACLGCPNQRILYKQYLEAANRSDVESCDLVSDQLGLLKCDKGQPLESVGQLLVWINFSHYIAIIFWFVILGPAGIVLYVLTRSLSNESCQNNDMKSVNHVASYVLNILDFVPSRLTGLAYVFVGNSSHTMAYIAKNSLDFSIDARQFISSAACIAESVDAPKGDCTTEPCILVRLAKRSVVFIVALVAVLTLLGFIA